MLGTQLRPPIAWVEQTMTSLVDSPSQRADLSRRASFESMRHADSGLSRGGIAIRLAIAAGVILLAVAAQVTTHEFDGGWFAAGIAFCAIIFGALALSLEQLRPLSAKAGAAWRDLAARRASRLADERFLARAQHDPRLMAELQVAVTRLQAQSDQPVAEAAKIDEAVRMHQRSLQDARVRMPVPMSMP